MAVSSTAVPNGSECEEPSRRDFLYIATGAVGAVGAAGIAVPLIAQLQPDAAVVAAGAPIDVDISGVAPGQQILVKWRGHPIFIVNRPPEALKVLQEQSLVSKLSDPDSKALQQPQYAANWHRSAKPEFLVLVGVCTHLGCIPSFQPNRGEVDASWPGGYFCPCHGSKYDLAGRVYSGVPAPYNLPVPPYTFTDAKTIRIGENPAGATFDLADIVQL